jgi:plasmid stability protein
MCHVPALHIRDVPESVVLGLKRRARANGRSLNAEIVELLKAYEDRDARKADLRRRLDKILSQPIETTGMPPSEELIRAGREERDRRIAGDL